MMRFLTILFLLFNLNVSAQFGQPRPITVVPPDPPDETVNIVMAAQNPLTDFSRPGGSEVWQFAANAEIISGVPTPQNSYFRLTWLDCESSTVQGNYSKLWSDPSQTNGVGRFRARVIRGLELGQTFGFGIMQLYPEVCSGGGYNSGIFYGGFCSSYPQYVHNLMQGQPTNMNDFNDGSSWIPAYNNPSWLARWDSLQRNIKRWLDTASHTVVGGPLAGQTITFINALKYVDIRGFGSYGEWHHCCIGGGYDQIVNWPGYINPDNPGTFATIATMKRIIDITKNAFTNFPCQAMIATYDGDRLGNIRVPVEVGIYALTTTNTFGKLGWRRDQWGDDSWWYHSFLEDNTMQFGGVRADTAILNRYKYNYVVGEPPGYNAAETQRNGVHMGWTPSQVQILHGYAIGNGNYGGNAPGGSSVDSMRKAFRIMGARILVTGGTMTTTLVNNSSFNVTLNMQNIGLATEHRAYTTQLILKNSGGTTVWTGNHSFVVKGFNPAAVSQSASTTFTLTGASIATGYNLYIRIIDPLSVTQPYPLGNTGRLGDGSYLVRGNITVAAAP